jgi:hypothetical protein
MTLDFYDTITINDGTIYTVIKINGKKPPLKKRMKHFMSGFRKGYLKVGCVALFSIIIAIVDYSLFLVAFKCQSLYWLFGVISALLHGLYVVPPIFKWIDERIE